MKKADGLFFDLGGTLLLEIKDASYQDSAKKDLYDLVQPESDPDAFYDKLLHKLDGRQRSDIVELQREYDALAERSNEIDQMILTLYEDKVRGVITPQRFVSLTEKLENEQKVTEEMIKQHNEAVKSLWEW